MPRFPLVAAVLFAACAGPLTAADPPYPAVLAGLSARCIGPANMGGRVTDIAVAERDSKIVYIATAGGGVWKSSDGGTTWTPVFDDQETLVIGSVAVAPSDPETVYVGTGEANPRNSVSWGRGIYRSRDGGKTWGAAALPDAGAVGRIAVHPKNPEVAYAAVLGRFWAPSRERGVYKTTDGGKTWAVSHFLDEDTGFVDLAMDPEEPDTLYAAAYPVRRDAFAGGAPRAQWGPNGGLYKTADAGKTWAKMTNGLPDRPYGRCGLSVHRKDPKVVYAIVQTDRTSGPTDNRGQVAKANEGDVEKGGVFKSVDRGKTWAKVNDLVPRPFYYGQIRVDPNDPQRVHVLGVQLASSTDGGKTFTTGGRGTHPDHHALWIDPANSDRQILGNDGGVYVTTNGGRAWEARRGFVASQFYGIAVDMRTPYRVYGGLQDNGSWGGPSATDRADGITLADWRQVGGGDGFRAAVDPTDPNTVYVESQNGNLRRLNQGQGAKGANAKSIRPPAPKGGPSYRYNWNSPILLSPHDPKTLYFGGNVVFKSTDRGDTWKAISGDLTHGRPGQPAVGHTLTTIAESPRMAGVLYAGSDDGRIHVSRDDGATWADVSKNVPGVAQDRWITSVECSHAEAGTAYVTIDRHRHDDRRPYVFKTTDYGATWTSITSNLPGDSPVHVVRESSRNPALLFAGLEHGLYASFDGGRAWHRFANGLPKAVAVQDLVIHPRDRDLVLGTHGRGIYVVTVGPLEELTEQAAGGPYLFAVKPAAASTPKQAGKQSPTEFRAANPPSGATLSCLLPADAEGPVTLAIIDGSGSQVRTWDLTGKVGFHQVNWDLRAAGQEAAPGTYTVTLQTARGTQIRPLRIEAGGKGS
jgi:photosystem II stability/assembly factor-like uncharacterized protein